MSEPFFLTYEQLHALCPKGNRIVLKGIAAHSVLLEEYDVSRNTLRLCHFLAQAAHETAGFKTLTEYGHAGYFRRLYGHRRDLGNTKLSDGPRYRGRGIFQLTGRYNYRRYGQILDIDLEARPELAQSPEISLRIACEYWRQHDLNRLADRNDIRAVTRRINGGYNGLADRQRYLQRALSVWSTTASSGPTRASLRQGDTGARVRRLQKYLAQEGYQIAIDGLFGRQTLRVLKAFQKSNHLKSDGVFGPRSQRKLYSGWFEAFIRRWFNLNFFPTFPSIKSKETSMDQWKSYFLSRTIWANSIGLAALALDVLGFNGISTDDQSQLIDQLLKLVEAGSFVAGAVFRAIARDRLGPSLF